MRTTGYQRGDVAPNRDDSAPQKAAETGISSETSCQRRKKSAAEYLVD